MFSSKQSASALDNFLQNAQRLDLSSITRLLMEPKVGQGWTKAQTIKAIAQYLAFLYLIDCYPHLQLVPSSEIEQVWNYHIQDARKYAEDCQMLFGYLIDRSSHPGLQDKQDDFDPIKAYALTQVLLAKYFNSNLMNQNSLFKEWEPIRSTATSNHRNSDLLSLQHFDGTRSAASTRHSSGF